MTTGGTTSARSGSGGGLVGVLVVLVLAVLLGVLFVAHRSSGSAPGTGHDPAVIALPKTVEGKRQLQSAEEPRTWPGTSRVPGAGLTGVRQGVYGDAAGTPTVWVVMSGPNEHGQVEPWLTANAPAASDATATHPQLPIAGTADCYQDQHDSRTTCTWYDENLFLLVAGPAGPDAVQQVLLRVHDGAEH
ncbi:hypothetical protein ACFW1A_10310 [Kitasatospora sp. NPDC058965]|uniref:hypothetical protein n=1 Tax=Kitasatospora sp. NPDC058965 TaxID=3346682 RepID=UPI0036C8FFFD